MLKRQLDHAFNNITAETCQRIIKKVRTIEERFWEEDARLDQAHENLILQHGNFKNLSIHLQTTIVKVRNQSHAALTVEIFGWIILVEGAILLVAPHAAAAVLFLPGLSAQAANYFRLAGLLVGGLGMLYVVSGRLSADEFVFASLLDRPLVPPAMAVLWYLDIIPGPLALVFAIQDFGSFLWTLPTWRAAAPSTRPG